MDADSVPTAGMRGKSGKSLTNCPADTDNRFRYRAAALGASFAKGKVSMSRRQTAWLGVTACLTLIVPACAQVPTVPAAPAGVAAPGVAGAAAPAAAPANLWSFLCPTPAQKQACMTCFCNSPIGMMLGGFAGPMTLMSGGLMQNPCIQNSILNDLKKPADSPEGAAARIKQDEADAAARREAVRYLGTVDCERWPEAIDTLKNALRKDRNECVRFEAALALRNGCCCNVQTIEALKNCVLGPYKMDPNPVECSERVRAVAAEALERCCLVEPPMPLPPLGSPILPPRVEGPPADPADYYKKIASMPREEVLKSARAVLVSMHQPASEPPVVTPGAVAPVVAAPPPIPVIGVPVHPTSVSEILHNAFVGCDHDMLRPPFFSHLTKELTGKQEYTIPARHALIPPPVNAAPPPAALPQGPELPPPQRLPEPLPPPAPPPAPLPARPPAPLPAARPKGNIAQMPVMPPASDIEPTRMSPAPQTAAMPQLTPTVELLPPEPSTAGGQHR